MVKTVCFCFVTSRTLRTEAKCLHTPTRTLHAIFCHRHVTGRPARHNVFTIIFMFIVRCLPCAIYLRTQTIHFFSFFGIVHRWTCYPQTSNIKHHHLKTSVPQTSHLKGILPAHAMTCPVLVSLQISCPLAALFRLMKTWHLLYVVASSLTLLWMMMKRSCTEKLLQKA